MKPETVFLEDICEISIGRTPSRNVAKYWGGTNPWLSISDMKGLRDISLTKESISDLGVREYNCKRIEPGTLLFSFKLSIGKVGFNSVPMYTNEAIAALPVKNPKRVDKNYLYWYLPTINFDSVIDTAAKGRTLNKAKLKELKINLPPLEEQRRIAEVLDKADALRQKRRLALQKLDTLLQSVFLEMFGDGIRQNKVEETRFGDIFKSVRYGTGSPPEYSEDGHPFIRATNIKNGTVVRKELKFISDADAKKISKCKVSYGDLVVVRSGVNSGDCALIPKEFDGAFAAYDLVVELDLTDAVFYNYVINSPRGKQSMKRLTRRAAQPHLNAEQLSSFIVPRPSKDDRDRFVELQTKTESIKSVIGRELLVFNRMFSSLQHSAFKGELS